MEVAFSLVRKSSVARVDYASHSQRTGLTGVEVLHLADPFPAQEPQDCVVVGGGNHIQKLEIEVGIERKKYESVEKSSFKRLVHTNYKKHIFLLASSGI